MRRSLLALLVLAAFPGSAAAAPVLVLGPHGAVSHRNDPFVSGPALTPAPAGGPARRPAPVGAAASGASVAATASAAGVSHSTSRSAKRRRRPPPTVDGVLARLYHTHAITQTVHQIAVAGAMTASRLPALVQTLDRNREWWTTGPLLSSGERVEFTGSQLVWEYYPGQGIQLQVLGTFGKANGLYTAGPADYPALEQLLAEMIPLGAQRAGGRTWEYYFRFDGGAPPWTSAMSQATGLEALTRGFQATGDQYYLAVARQALPVFSAHPPAGVSVQTALGRRYLQYTFAPGAAIINAFLQTLIGLDDYARVSGNPQVAQLFAAGNAEAMAELPHYDTGAWSLYQPGIEDDLSYHELVTGFLEQLCTLTRAPVYCTTAQHFQAYLKTPPVLSQLTFSGRARGEISFRFGLSKYSRVGITITQGTTTKFLTSASFPYGVDYFTIPALRRAGRYGVRLAATDLAGNFARITGTLAVSR